MPAGRGYLSHLMTDTSVGNGGGEMLEHTPGGLYYNVLASIRCSPKEGNTEFFNYIQSKQQISGMIILHMNTGPKLRYQFLLLVSRFFFSDIISVLAWTYFNTRMQIASVWLSSKSMTSSFARIGG